MAGLGSIGLIEDVMSTFYVSGSKNTVSAKNFTILPAGDMSGDINDPFPPACM